MQLTSKSAPVKLRFISVLKAFFHVDFCILIDCLHFRVIFAFSETFTYIRMFCIFRYFCISDGHTLIGKNENAKQRGKKAYENKSIRKYETTKTSNNKKYPKMQKHKNTLNG